MVTSSGLITDFNNLINSTGQILRIKRYTQTILGGGSSYDDDISLSHMTGSDTWTSGVVQNIGGGGGFGQVGGGGFNSNEAFLMEQGKLLAGDKRLYVAGSHEFSGAAFKIGLGSPPTDEYRLTEAGILAYPIQGNVVYQKLFIRILTAGSIFGE